MPNNIKNINRQIAKGSVWMVLFKVFEKSISIISTIILARLLVPEDFGLVAIAMMVVGFLDLMRAFGFDMALIQNQQATRDHYNTAWTFNILAALIISISLLTLTPLAASFYEDSRLLNIIPLLAIGVLFSGFENIGVVAFRKELKFHKEFIYMLSKKVISFVTAISLAFYFRNYWALIGAFIITRIGVVALSYFIHNYRPALSLKCTRELIGFSSWLFLNNIISFIMNKAPEAIIGKMSGMSALGIFNVSKDITYSTSSSIVLPINRAAFPGFSKLNDNLPALKDSFLNTIGMIAFIIIPTSAGIAAVAPVMVASLLGKNWLESIYMMQILSFSGLFFATANITLVYTAMGKPKIGTIIMTTRILIFIPALIYATSIYGTIGAAWSLLATSIIMLPISYWPVMRILRIKIIEISSRFIRPILATIAMFFIINYAYTNYIINDTYHYSISELMILIAIGVVTYSASLLMLWILFGYPEGSEKQIIETLRKKIFQ